MFTDHEEAHHGDDERGDGAVPGVSHAVHTLALMEPARPVPPTEERAQFVRDFVAPAVQRYRAGDKAGAVDTFARGVFGSDYRGPLRDSRESLTKPSPTRMRSSPRKELPALKQWAFTQQDASRITQPTLAVLGENTAPTFPERLQLLVSWLPNAEPVEVPTTHLLHVRNPRRMAEVLAGFYARHPLAASTAYHRPACATNTDRQEASISHA